MDFQIQMPKLCAKCGENPPIKFHTVKEERVSLSPWTLLTMFFGVALTNRRTITYPVPVCEVCDAKITAKQTFWGRVGAVGIIMVVGAVLLFCSQTTALATIPFFISLSERFKANSRDLIVLALFVVGVIIIFTAMFLGKARFASTNGKTFRFYNKEFQKAFAELNPDLIKRKRG